MTSHLAGVRVLDLCRLMPGAIATGELARLGANVVKVEMPPYGDYFRVTPPLINGRGDMHLDLSRSKRSLCIDFADERGRDVVKRMATTADVFVESSTPGAMASLGLDHHEVLAQTPSLVYCSISGFGQSGPLASLPAHGLSADAAAGLLGDVSEATEFRLPDPYVSVGPRAAGLHAALAICASLVRRGRTGLGEYIDVSQADAAIAWNYRELDARANGVPPPPAYRDLGPLYACYATQDGETVLFAAPEQALFQRFCAVCDRPDLAETSWGSGQLVRYDADPDLRAKLTEVFARHSVAEWLSLAATHGIPIAPVVQARNLAGSSLVGDRRMLVGGVDANGHAIGLSGAPTTYASGEAELRPAPELGEHNVEVLEEYGFTPHEIDQLLSRRIVRAAAAE